MKTLRWLLITFAFFAIGAAFCPFAGMVQAAGYSSLIQWLTVLVPASLASFGTWLTTRD